VVSLLYDGGIVYTMVVPLLRDESR